MVRRTVRQQHSYAIRLLMCGADGDISNCGIDNVVWIYDNEPREQEDCQSNQQIQSIEATP